MAILEMDIRKVLHDPTELVTRALQPVLWLFVFGGALGRFQVISTGGVPYQSFLIPGVLAQSMLFISIFFGISIIWERDLGLLQKLLALPLPRNVFVLGKALAAGFRSLTQVVFILLLALLVGIPLRWGAFNLIAVMVTIVFGSVLFSSLSMILAALLKTRERFMGFGQLFTMPLFFASNALYPIEVMPAWLKVLAKVNPLTYIVDLMRSLLISGDLSRCGTDLAVLVLTMLALLAIATRVYPRAAY
ncbi:MAG: ABC transporter permease [Firmicutes bacterium]|nr:ABC transporter permease [Bacillota bacterium]